MNLSLVYEYEDYKGVDKLKGKVVFIIGGDSGIGCVVFVVYVKEGVDIVIVYKDEYGDVEEMKKCVE